MLVRQPAPMPGSRNFVQTGPAASVGVGPNHESGSPKKPTSNPIKSSMIQKTLNA